MKKSEKKEKKMTANEYQISKKIYIIIIIIRWKHTIQFSCTNLDFETYPIYKMYIFTDMIKIIMNFMNTCSRENDRWQKKIMIFSHL